MAHVGHVARWDLLWVDSGTHVGSEQGGERRPALVISSDGFNQHFDVVTFLPLTKRGGRRRRIYTPSRCWRRTWWGQATRVS